MSALLILISSSSHSNTTFLQKVVGAERKDNSGQDISQNFTQLSRTFEPKQNKMHEMHGKYQAKISILKNSQATENREDKEFFGSHNYR